MLSICSMYPGINLGFYIGLSKTRTPAALKPYTPRPNPIPTPASGQRLESGLSTTRARHLPLRTQLVKVTKNLNQSHKKRN